jgi:hypothetical protein
MEKSLTGWNMSAMSNTDSNLTWADATKRNCEFITCSQNQPHHLVQADYSE